MALIGSSYTENPRVAKYYEQRYRLWSKFDEGVHMTEEGWWTVTMEPIAARIAEKMAALGKHNLVVDVFCGCGGNSIQLAKHFDKVVAIDRDSSAIAAARKNAAVYGVDHKIEFHCCDLSEFSWVEFQRIDAVFLSPPWGGDHYSHEAYFSVDSDLKRACGYSLKELFDLCRANTCSMAAFLPRNILAHDVALSLSAQENIFEIEAHMCNERIKAVTVYVGQSSDKELSRDNGSSHISSLTRYKFRGGKQKRRET